MANMANKANRVGAESDSSDDFAGLVSARPRFIDDIRIPQAIERPRICSQCKRCRMPQRFDQISNLGGLIYNWDGTPQRYAICQDCRAKTV